MPLAGSDHRPRLSESAPRCRFLGRPVYDGLMGLHDRDYYRDELTKRDGYRSIVFRFGASFRSFRAILARWLRSL